jgi:hypothetical protein
MMLARLPLRFSRAFSAGGAVLDRPSQSPNQHRVCGVYIFVGDPRFRLEHYLAKAAEAMDHARRAPTEDQRAYYLHAAEYWAALAKQAEEPLRDQKDLE